MSETVCEILLEREREQLSPFAAHAADTKGREIKLEPCTLRTEYQRDRDRIIHSKSFRRLMHKTQVFLSPEDDHYRTRLTHTLEVTQIARTIARSLFLNEDLTEAISLGHDLGHTPFGHAGERVLDRCFPGGFLHNAQSLRVVEKLEGLNLTYEVRNGIYCHVWGFTPETLEGKIVQFADRIAYINHDIDDACRGGVMAQSDIPKDITDILGQSHGGRIDTMVRSVVESSAGKNEITMGKTILEATLALREFLFERVYKNPAAKSEEGKAEAMLEKLYYYYLDRPELLPRYISKFIPEDGKERAVCDHIAGMTDRYAINTYKDLFIPEVWKK